MKNNIYTYEMFITYILLTMLLYIFDIYIKVVVLI